MIDKHSAPQSTDHPLWGGIHFGDEVVATAWQSADAHSFTFHGPVPAVLAMSPGRVVLGDWRRAAYEAEGVAASIRPALGSAAHPDIIDGHAWRPEALAALVLRCAAQLGRPSPTPPSSISSSSYCSSSSATPLAVTGPPSAGAQIRHAQRQAAKLAQFGDILIVSELAAAAAGWLECQEWTGKSAEKHTLAVTVGATACHWALIRRQGNEAIVERHGRLEEGNLAWRQSLLDQLAEELHQCSDEPAYGPLNANMWQRSKQPLVSSLIRQLSRRDVASWETIHQGELYRGEVAQRDWESLTQPLATRLLTRIQDALSEGGADSLLLLSDSPLPATVQYTLATGLRLPLLTLPLDSVELFSVGAACLARQRDAAWHGKRVTDVAPHALGVQTVDRKRNVAMNNVVVEANAAIPVSRNIKMGQVSASPLIVKLLQGAEPRASDNIPLGQCELDVELGKSAVLKLGFDRNGEVEAMLEVEGSPPQPIAVEYSDALPDIDEQVITQQIQRLAIHVGDHKDSMGSGRRSDPRS